MNDTKLFTNTRTLQSKHAPANQHLLLFSALAVALAPDRSVAEARLTKIQITSRESPTFAGRTFGSVGQYEKIIGKAFGAVDPADSRKNNFPARR